MNTVQELIHEFGVIPVVVLDDAKDAAPLAKALCDGGLPCAEVTFRTAAAEESIRIITKEYPDMFVGAGTVLTIDQLNRALDAGARFIVSPGFDPEIVDACQSREVPVFPGISTATELIQAVKKGLEVVKFFPAEQAGGPAMIKALGAAFPQVKFMPTGGISPSNLEKYLSSSKIIACGGSWMVKGDLIRAGKFDEIQTLVEEAVALTAKIRG